MESCLPRAPTCLLRRRRACLVHLTCLLRRRRACPCTSRASSDGVVPASCTYVPPPTASCLPRAPHVPPPTASCLPVHLTCLLRRRRACLVHLRASSDGVVPAS